MADFNASRTFRSQQHTSNSREPPGTRIENVAESPRSPLTPETSSDESLDDNAQNATPPETPPRDAVFPGLATPELSQMSISQNQLPDRGPASIRGRGHARSGSAITSKRAASSDLTRNVDREETTTEPLRDNGSPAAQQPILRRPSPTNHAKGSRALAATHRLASHTARMRSGAPPAPTAASKKLKAQLHKDSGYESDANKHHSAVGGQIWLDPAGAMTGEPLTIAEHKKASHLKPILGQRSAVRVPALLSQDNEAANHSYPGLILQPDSSPISQDQLAAEVKGIYAGLVMVEAKCINIDAAQAADPLSQLGQEQWQALIALHRTLLYEHHDFLMATQHPSATDALRGLAMRYSMPARMWKHGIHAFLEVLRHRRPDSQDYMLAFIYLAYQMMALLYETVPSFLDTWIECLGDLARYRMAIEEEKEPHAQWAGVASSWYTKAADRHPQVGRLYHHLGILERPSLRKFACYGKSLTCVVPFLNARDSMMTLCNPIVAEGEPVRGSTHSAETSLCRLYALMYLQKDRSTIHAALTKTCALLETGSFQWKDCGVPLAVTSISPLLGYGSSTNALRCGYDAIIEKAVKAERPAYAAKTAPATMSAAVPHDVNQPHNLLTVAQTITLFTFHTALRRGSDANTVRDTLPYVHTMLCFIHSLHLVKSHHTSDMLHGHHGVSWKLLASYLNGLLRLEPLTVRVEQCARTGVSMCRERGGDSRPLPEDYAIRGLVWSYHMFGPAWFSVDEDEFARTVETASTLKARVERALYYGLRLAFESDYLRFDARSRTFSAVGDYHDQPNEQAATEASSIRPTNTTEASVESPIRRSSARQSSSPDSDFVHVHRPQPTQPPAAVKAQAPARSWAAVASARKPRHDNAEVQVVDPDSMELGGR